MLSGSEFDFGSCMDGYCLSLEKGMWGEKPIGFDENWLPRIWEGYCEPEDTPSMQIRRIERGLAALLVKEMSKNGEDADPTPISATGMGTILALGYLCGVARAKIEGSTG